MKRIPDSGTESGMVFRLPDDNCFPVEKHHLAKASWQTTSQNIKACEFVTYDNDKHVFVEAKSSAPLGRNGNVGDLRLNGKKLPDNWTAYDNYTTFLRNITKKFIDSYYILRALSEKRHGVNGLEDINLPVKTVNNDNVEFTLIVNLQENAGNVSKQSFAQLKEALTNEMRPFLHIWNISTDSVKVLWPSIARRRYSFEIDFE